MLPLPLFLGIPASLTLGVSVPPVFELNLSAPARTRWRGALAAVLKAHPFESSWLPTFAQHNESLFDSLQPEQWSTLRASFEHHFPEQAEELHGIHDDFSELLPEAGVTFDYLVGWVYFHELAHTPLAKSASGSARECTALLARAPSMAAGVVHVGNMDQSPSAVRNLTLAVNFRLSDGSVAYRGVDWYWFTTGVSRAVKAGVASLQENWRTGMRTTAAMLASIEAGVVPQILVFRRALSQHRPGQYEALETWLEEVPLAAPFYVIAAAPHGRGVAIARSPDGVDGKQALGNVSATVEEVAAAADEAWFLVQTNYDHWLPDPPSDPRRSQAEAMLSQLGAPNAASQLGLFAVASAYPVHNPHTAYTALMDPASGALSAYVRRALCPVDMELASVDSRYCTKRKAVV